MKQINNGFKSCYYLTEEGYIYNADSNKNIYPNNKNFRLKKEDDSTVKISLKKLYYLVFEKHYCIDNIKDLDNEVWKEIDNTNGTYLVSNKGRVKSIKGYEAIILKPMINHSGYLKVELLQDKQRVIKFIHRLVAAAFLETPQNIDMQIHHIDFNNTNNCAENLKWLNVVQHRLVHNEHRKELKNNGNSNNSTKSKDNNN